MKSIFYILSFLVLCTPLFAQTNSDYLDPSKYNSDFKGIGPSVYILPPPKTEKQLLTERYETKKQNNTRIDSLLEKLTFLQEIKTIPTVFAIEHSLAKSEEEMLIEAVDYFTKKEDQGSLADWQNNLAVYYIKNERFKEAHSLLLSSLAKQLLIGTEANKQIVLQNLAMLEIKNDDMIATFALFDQFLSDALKTKNVHQQIIAYLSLARLEAKVGEFTRAHNLIIKKGIPLLQKRKDYRRIVLALNDLALIKEIQEENTEAKWIYLQAIDVASKNEDETGLAISYFNLAKIKHKIGDEKLAISDYKEAKRLATENNMKYLLIAINDKLGDAYLKLNDLKTATALLNEYHVLKTSLLNQYL